MIAGLDAVIFSLVVFAITCVCSLMSYYIGYDKGYKDGYRRRKRIDDITRWRS